MCGITGIFNIQEQTPELRQKALRMSQKVRHRGPDWSGIYTGPTAILCHERLSIVDPESGKQPLFAPDKKQVLAVNGEIYNHQDIRNQFKDYDFQTGSDCEVILALYRQWKREGADPKKITAMIEKLSGIFAFALYDVEDGSFLIARDPIGVIPLYIGYDPDGKVYMASELKALEGQCDHYEPFLPGHYYWSHEADKGQQKWYTRDWMQDKTRTEKELSYGQAVEEIRIDVAQEIADVEREVGIADERLDDRREETAEEGVDRADDEEEQEGAREEMMLDRLPVNSHGQPPALRRCRWPWRWPRRPPYRRARARGLRACRALRDRADGASSPRRCGRDTRR